MSISNIKKASYRQSNLQMTNSDDSISMRTRSFSQFGRPKLTVNQPSSKFNRYQLMASTAKRTRSPMLQMTAQARSNSKSNNDLQAAFQERQRFFNTPVFGKLNEVSQKRESDSAPSTGAGSFEVNGQADNQDLQLNHFEEYFTKNERIATKPGQWGYVDPNKKFEVRGLQFEEEYFTMNERIATKPGQFGYVSPKSIKKSQASMSEAQNELDKFNDEYFLENERRATQPGQFGYVAPPKSPRRSLVQMSASNKLQFEEESHTMNERMATKPGQFGYVAPTQSSRRGLVKMSANSNDHQFQEEPHTMNERIATKPGQWGYNAPAKSARSSLVKMSASNKPQYVEEQHTMNERIATKPGQWGYNAPKKTAQRTLFQILMSESNKPQFEEEQHTKNERIPTNSSQWGYVAPKVTAPRSAVKMWSTETQQEFYEEYFTQNERYPSLKASHTAQYKEKMNQRFTRNVQMNATKVQMMDNSSWDRAWRQPVVGGNWKSNGDRDFINSYPKQVLNKSKWDADYMQVCVAPTDIHLSAVQKEVSPEFDIMAQNVSQYPSGAFTGNITAEMLKDIGVSWALTGHSERRTKNGTTDQDVALKTKVAIENGMIVMACIGEGLEERELGKADKINARQLQAIADELTEDQWSNVVIAYEPVWAIGTGKVATAEIAQETHANIRSWLKQNVSQEVAEATRILYGGSVNAKNCKELIKQADIDGFLVGGASLTPDFKEIIETVSAYSVEQTI